MVTALVTKSAPVRDACPCGERLRIWKRPLWSSSYSSVLRAPYAGGAARMVYNSRTPRVLICSGEHLRQGVVCQAVKARWSFDARFGKKSETVELLIEWIREIGSGIGLTARNTRLGAGQIGAPESRVELEVEFRSLEELERFWASIPADKHRDWSARAQSVILDGTPRWEVLQSVPVASAFGIANQSAASAAPPPPATSSGTAGGGVAAAFSRLGGSGRRFKPVETRSGASGASIVFGDDENNPQVLDLQFDGGNDPSAIVERTESGIAIVRLNQGDGEAAAGRSRVGNWGSEAGTGVASGRDGTEGTRGPKGGSDGGDGEGSGLGGRGRSRFRGSPGSGPDVFSEVLRDAGLSEQEPAVSLEEEVRRDRRVIEQSQRGLAQGGQPVDWKGDPMVINPGDRLPFAGSSPPPPRRDPDDE